MGIFLAGINISARCTVTVRVEDVSGARDAEPMISEGILVSKNYNFELALPVSLATWSFESQSYWSAHYCLNTHF